MGKTVPAAFPWIRTSSLLPLEPIVEGGETPSPRCLQDLALGMNWLVANELPVVVNQPMMFLRPGLAGARRLSTDDQADPDARTLRLVYRAPEVQNHASAPKYVVKATVAGDVGTSGEITFETSVDSEMLTFAGAGAWEIRSPAAVDFDPDVVETIRVHMERTAGAGEICLKHLAIWPEPGPSPVPFGLDVEGWAADAPLASYLPQLLSLRASWLLKHRRSVTVSWSWDLEQLGRGYTLTDGTERPVARIPFLYGPRTSQVRVWASAYQDGDDHYLKAWTDHVGESGAVAFTVPDSVAWDPETSWESVDLDVEESDLPRVGILSVEMFADPGVNITLAGLCAHEIQG